MVNPQNVILELGILEMHEHDRDAKLVIREMKNTLRERYLGTKPENIYLPPTKEVRMTPDERVDRMFKWTIIAIIFLCILGFVVNVFAEVQYDVVEPNELTEDDSGRHVVVAGWSHDFKQGRGRFGSNTSQMEVEGLLIVCNCRFFDDVIGENVLVAGTYRHYCKFGGMLMDGPCIIVDAIMGSR